eukprot:647811-Pyramimonas_sp.AAC.1
MNQNVQLRSRQRAARPSARDRLWAPFGKTVVLAGVRIQGSVTRSPSDKPFGSCCTLVTRFQ